MKTLIFLLVLFAFSGIVASKAKSGFVQGVAGMVFAICMVLLGSIGDIL